MARKLTVSVVRRIRKLAASGATVREIAAKVGVSRGSVSNALGDSPSPKRPVPAVQVPAPPADGDPAVPVEPPTPEEFRAYLSQQLHELHSDAEAARANGDDVALGRAQRLATQTAVMLARMTRDAPLATDQVLVDRSKMQDAADRGFAKLVRYVEIEEARRRAETGR